MLKKHICILLVLLLAVTFTGCRNAPADEASESTELVLQKEEAKTPEPESGKDSVKTAVVYFSATGTTAEVAQMIASTTNADIFEIIPEEVYTSEDLDYNDDNCRANKEMNDAAARPAISTDLSAVSEYDVIYLGHPIWWGTAPRIIQTFLESYDVSQAAVYTFCTSGGSGIEQSVKDLQGLYPDVNVMSGKRFSKADETEIKDWLDSLE